MIARWTVLLSVNSLEWTDHAAGWLAHPEVERVVAVLPPEMALPPADDPHRLAFHGRGESSSSTRKLWEAVKTSHAVLVREAGRVRPGPAFFQRFANVLEQLAGGAVFSHYRQEKSGSQMEDIPVPPFQAGSARDTFPGGPVLACDTRTVKLALMEEGPLAMTEYAGSFELLLRLARRNQVFRLPEYLYTHHPGQPVDDHQAHFAYVAREAGRIQREREEVFTRHLKNLGAWLPVPDNPLPPFTAAHPCDASVIIPVRNRVHTIAGAIASAAGQEFDGSFNILVVDNHSTDGTRELLSGLSARYPQLRVLTPPETGRGIGGCWQLAIESSLCGRYAVQLDSDDLYSSPGSLQTMVSSLRSGPFALAAGSYRLVNERLEDIPPGLIDHREWTLENGHNNLLRVEGIGAPRAYHVPALRLAGFPDVSYGEDYAAALALSRRYRVARVFEPVYLCRRWSGNTDSGLSPARKAAHHEYKDFLRTAELQIRRRLARSGFES